MITGLSPDNEAFLLRLVSSGRFPTPEAALNEAVQTLREVTTESAANGDVAKQRSADEWIKDIKEWADKHRPVNTFVDDSRESIY